MLRAINGAKRVDGIATDKTQLMGLHPLHSLNRMDGPYQN